MGGQRHAPGRFTPAKETRYPLTKKDTLFYNYTVQDVWLTAAQHVLLIEEMTK